MLKFLKSSKSLTSRSEKLGSLNEGERRRRLTSLKDGGVRGLDVTCFPGDLGAEKPGLTDLCVSIDERVVAEKEQRGRGKKISSRFGDSEGKGETHHKLKAVLLMLRIGS